MKYLFVVSMIVLMGCGGDADSKNNENNDGGEFSAEFSGAVEDTLSLGDGDLRGASDSGSTVTLTYGPIDGPSVVIGFVGLEPGVVGDGVASFVTYRNTDGAEWNANDCLGDITRNDLAESDPDFGDTYFIAGTIECTSAATPRTGDATGEVTIESVSFEARTPLRE